MRKKSKENQFIAKSPAKRREDKFIDVVCIVGGAFMAIVLMLIFSTF